MAQGQKKIFAGTTTPLLREQLPPFCGNNYPPFSKNPPRAKMPVCPCGGSIPCGNNYPPFSKRANRGKSARSGRGFDAGRRAWYNGGETCEEYEVYEAYQAYEAHEAYEAYEVWRGKRARGGGRYGSDNGTDQSKGRRCEDDDGPCAGGGARPSGQARAGDRLRPAGQSVLFDAGGRYAGRAVRGAAGRRGGFRCDSGDAAGRGSGRVVARPVRGGYGVHPRGARIPAARAVRRGCRVLRPHHRGLPARAGRADAQRADGGGRHGDSGGARGVFPSGAQAAF